MEKIVQVLNLDSREEKFVKIENLIDFCEQNKMDFSRIPDLSDLSDFSQIRIKQFVFKLINVF